MKPASKGAAMRKADSRNSMRRMQVAPLVWIKASVRTSGALHFYQEFGEFLLAFGLVFARFGFG
jgi:hypothetical protein